MTSRIRWAGAILATFTAAALAAAAAVAHGTRNYLDPAGPRDAGAPPAIAADPDAATLHVVTFNVRFAHEPDAAARLLREDPSLAGADLVALEEMDAPGARHIAAALQLRFVYYAGSTHPRAGTAGTGSDFGVALLSRWPIAADRKLLLPGRSFPSGRRRIGVAADVETPGGRLRVYALHLETPFAITPGMRSAQLAAVLDDARTATTPVLVLGDMNGHDLPGEVFGGAGYDWPTRDTVPTVGHFAWDHVFAKGLPAPATAGVVGSGSASDHAAVWVRFSTAPRTSSPASPPPSSSVPARATPPA